MKAIMELDERLTAAGIPHVLRDMGSYGDHLDFGWQIVYPSIEAWSKDEAGSGDVVWNEASYGHEADLLEAMGFDIPNDDVRGYLTVDEAFGFFERQWKKDQGNETAG